MATNTESEIQEARVRLANALAAVRGELMGLESLLRGRVGPPTSTTPAPSTQPRISLYSTLLEGAAAIPTVTPELGTPEILSQLSRYGLRDRSFDVVVPVTVPNPITAEGNSYDAGDIYDAWIVNPSVDTRIAFDKAPTPNTPFIAANTFMHFAVRKQKIYFLGVTNGVTGTLQLWLLKYVP